MTNEESPVKETRADLKARKKKEKADAALTSNTPKIKFLVRALVVVVILMLGVAWIGSFISVTRKNSSSPTTTSAPATTTTSSSTVSPAATVTPVSTLPASTTASSPVDIVDDMNSKVIAGGVTSTKEVLSWLGKQPPDSQKDYLVQLKSLTGLTYKDLLVLAGNEKKGKNYSAYLPKGTVVVNTYRGKDGKIHVISRYTLTRGRFVILDGKGRPWTFMSCGNQIHLIKVTKNKHIRRVKRPSKRHVCNPAGLEKGNPTYLAPADTGRTPGSSASAYQTAVNSRGLGSHHSGIPATGNPTVDEGKSVRADGKVIIKTAVPTEVEKDAPSDADKTKEGNPTKPQ